MYLKLGGRGMRVACQRGEWRPRLYGMAADSVRDYGEARVGGGVQRTFRWLERWSCLHERPNKDTN